MQLRGQLVILAICFPNSANLHFLLPFDKTTFPNERGKTTEKSPDTMQNSSATELVPGKIDLSLETIHELRKSIWTMEFWFTISLMSY